MGEFFLQSVIMVGHVVFLPEFNVGNVMINTLGRIHEQENRDSWDTNILIS